VTIVRSPVRSLNPLPTFIPSARPQSGAVRVGRYRQSPDEHTYGAQHGEVVEQVVPEPE
jgi:hypothetical protein